MGRYGLPVLDADGHGGEPLGWRRRIPDAYRSQMLEYVRLLKEHYGRTTRALPGGGMQVNEANPSALVWAEDEYELNPPSSMRPGMYDPGPRIEDMDLEGIDVAVLFPPGSGEEFALGDAKFSAALCRTLNDARAEFASYAPDRFKLVAKLPMIDPPTAAEELERCVTELGFVGLVCAQHILDKNLDHPSFDVVWEAAQRLGAAVCVHGGGQAPGQVPFVIERLDSPLTIHAFTHPVGAMLALTCFTVGGILHRFPELRVGFMEAGAGWLPFWLERLDEHWEHVPQHAPSIDRPPSEYFMSGRCFIGCEPGESTLPYVAESVGDGVLCYASDYCHWDCAFPDTVKIVVERDDLSEDRKAAILGGNASSLYGIPLPVPAG